MYNNGKYGKSIIWDGQYENNMYVIQKDEYRAKNTIKIVQQIYNFNKNFYYKNIFYLICSGTFKRRKRTLAIYFSVYSRIIFYL